jgi:hypothetical protein
MQPCALSGPCACPRSCTKHSINLQCPTIRHVTPSLSLRPIPPPLMLFPQILLPLRCISLMWLVLHVSILQDWRARRVGRCDVHASRICMDLGCY